MILKAFTLENFKGIRERVRVEFAPLTLLFGPNNAGKSTIVQALMYAREVLARNNCDVTRTELGGDVVDLGGFRNLIHGHDAGRAIIMRFELAVGPRRLPSTIHADEFEDYKGEFNPEYDVRSARFDVSRLSQARAQLTEIWVELEIAQRKTSPQAAQSIPVVTNYRVGNSVTAYAEIAFDENSGRAALSFLDSSMFPLVATRYTQGDQSDFDWDFSRIVRSFIRKHLKQRGSEKRGLRKGATVAANGELVEHGDNKMPRQDFDALVSQVINGEGDWGDDSVDPATGKIRSQFAQRQKLLALAEAARRVREGGAIKGTDEKSQVGDEDIDFEDLFDFELTDDATRLLRSDLLALDELDQTEELDGLLPIPMVLTIRGTALPAWDEQLQPFEDVIQCEDDSQEEYLLDFLSSIIAGPGKLLLEVLQEAIYLGPYRRLPSRHYRSQDIPANADWASGLAAWQLLMEEENQGLVDQVNNWLSASKTGFGADYSISIQRYKSLDLDSLLWSELMSGDLSVLAESIRQKLDELPEETKKLELTNTITGVRLAPQDLGVGISQVIPVVVAALYKNSGAVAIEEPESNVHPAFQVVLADLVITQAKANPDVLFLVETHSEHLMLRCLRRIRETAKGSLPKGFPAVAPEDVAVHFVEATKEGPKIKRIEIDEEGDFIDDWPGGFFEESYRERFAGR